MAGGAANHGRSGSKQAHCPHRFTTCRLTCLPSTVALAGVVAHGAREQVKLVDEGRALVESVVDPEIELRIGEPAQPAVDLVTDVEISGRPGIDISSRDRARIPVATGVVHGALDRPAVGATTTAFPTKPELSGLPTVST